MLFGGDRLLENGLAFLQLKSLGDELVGLGPELRVMMHSFESETDTRLLYKTHYYQLLLLLLRK